MCPGSLARNFGPTGSYLTRSKPQRQLSMGAPLLLRYFRTRHSCDGGHTIRLPSPGWHCRHSARGWVLDPRPVVELQRIKTEILFLNIWRKYRHTFISKHAIVYRIGHINLMWYYIDEWHSTILALHMHTKIHQMRDQPATCFIRFVERRQIRGWAFRDSSFIIGTIDCRSIIIYATIRDVSHHPTLSWWPWTSVPLPSQRWTIDRQNFSTLCEKVICQTNDKYLRCW